MSLIDSLLSDATSPFWGWCLCGPVFAWHLGLFNPCQLERLFYAVIILKRPRFDKPVQEAPKAEAAHPHQCHIVKARTRHTEVTQKRLWQPAILKSQPLEFFSPTAPFINLDLSAVSLMWRKRVGRHIPWPMGGALGQGAARWIASRC